VKFFRYACRIKVLSMTDRVIHIAHDSICLNRDTSFIIPLCWSLMRIKLSQE
jgi:hypothetical protein